MQNSQRATGQAVPSSLRQPYHIIRTMTIEVEYGLPATNVWSHNQSVNLESISRRMRYRTGPVVPPHYVELTTDLKPLCPTIVLLVKNVHPLTGVDKKSPRVLFMLFRKKFARFFNTSNFLVDQSREPVLVCTT